MTVCEQLATKAELRALEQRLTAEINKKLNASEKQSIVNAATQAVKGLIPGFLQPIKTELQAVKAIANTAKSKAENAIAEVNRIKNALGSKLDKSEKPAIIQQGAIQGKDLALSAVGGLLSAYTLLTQHNNLKGEVSQVSAKTNILGNRVLAAQNDAKRAIADANLAKVSASAAKAQSHAAKISAAAADRRARIADSKAGNAISKATRAITQSSAAQKLARGAQSLANRAIGLVNTLTGAVRALDVRLGGALSKIANLAGKVLGILNTIATIFSIIATLASLVQLYRLTQQVNALEAKVNAQDRLIQQIRAIIESIRGELSRLNGVASTALNNSLAALSRASSALSQSSQAISTSQRALSSAISAARNAAIASAAAAAASAVANRAINAIPSIRNTANNALSKAEQALRQKAKPGPDGPRGLPGPAGAMGPRGFTGATGPQGAQGPKGDMGPFGSAGKNGKDGAPGKNGKDGKDGKDAMPDPEVKRLLYRINRTTTSNLALDTTTNANVIATRTVVDRTKSVLDGLNTFTRNAWKFARIDKALNALNTILLLHNAAMLSRNLATTLGDLTSQALSVIGIKDETGSPLDINKEIGRQIDQFFASALGEEVWKNTKTTWHKANNIISSASNIIWTIRSMQDSAREIMEWTAENTGKIGNALKKFGVVGENAYKWMPEQMTMTNRWTQRIDRFRNKTEDLDDAASSLSSVLGEVQNIQEEYGQLQEQKAQFDKNLQQLTPKERSDNESVKETVETSKKEAAGPTINKQDLIKPEVDDAA